jgi:hypothetical protein
MLPARIAFDRAKNPEIKAAAAELLYQSYQALHKNDSALLWLGRADSTGENHRIDAVALYQSAGRLIDARAVLDKIIPSFDRDTLTIRQYVFEGNMKGALEALHNANSRWTQKTNEMLLWKARILLFSGSFDEVTMLLDSAVISPRWKGAKEVLDYRLGLHLYQGSSDALSVWSRIVTALYIGKPEEGEKTLAVAQALPTDLAIALQLLIIRDLLARERVDAAMAFFAKHGEGTMSPEYLYLHADAELKSGQVTLARDLLLRIIGDFPSDVFAEKARVLLSRLERK